MEKMNYPSISVVIPSFNQGNFIEDTIISVIGQQYPNLEVIVIDGGSNDNTVEIIKKYEDKISYWHSQPDRGQADAINQGFKLSSGDILCWLNSDDMYFPGTLLKVAKILGKNEANKLIYGGCILFHDCNNGTQGRLPPPFDANKLTYFDYIDQPSSFWTRKVWENVGELNINYNYIMDWEWFIRASKICDFIPVTDYFSLYRLHSQHKTSTGKNKRNSEIIQLLEQYAEEKWINLYKDVNCELDALKSNLNNLNRLRENLYYNLKININIYKLRYFLHHKLYLTYSTKAIEEFALRMLD